MTESHPQPPNTTTVLILDFDGVIVESIPLKTVAFRKIFSFAPPEHLDEIIAFHLENGGMSRYDKFRHIYANILPNPSPPSRRSGSRTNTSG